MSSNSCWDRGATALMNCGGRWNHRGMISGFGILGTDCFCCFVAVLDCETGAAGLVVVVLPLSEVAGADGLGCTLGSVFGTVGVVTEVEGGETSATVGRSS